MEGKENEETVVSKYMRRISECDDINKLEEMHKEISGIDQEVLPNEEKGELLGIIHVKRSELKIESFKHLSNKELLKACREEKGKIKKAALDEAQIRGLQTGWRYSKLMIILTIIIILIALTGSKYWDPIIDWIKHLMK